MRPQKMRSRVTIRIPLCSKTVGVEHTPKTQTLNDISDDKLIYILIIAADIHLITYIQCNIGKKPKCAMWHGVEIIIVFKASEVSQRTQIRQKMTLI